jgi:hypothetical protein
MNRLSRVAVLVAVALGVLVPVSPVHAGADPIGGLIVIPGTGTDLDPLRLRTSAGCPMQANAYYARMRGHDLPPDGQIITSTTKAGLSHSIGFDVYVALIMRDYANKNRTTLGGRYDITVYCINRLTLESYGEFTGSLEFTSPKTYEAIGAAKPVGPPPPPRERAADGSAVDPDAALPPSGSPPAPGPPGGWATGQLAPSTAAQAPIDQASGADPQAQSPAGQLASQRNDVTSQVAPWLILILVGAVLCAALVFEVVRRQIRKRRSS